MSTKVRLWQIFTVAPHEYGGSFDIHMYGRHLKDFGDAGVFCNAPTLLPRDTAVHWILTPSLFTIISSDPTALSRTFTDNSSTHSYKIYWTHFGKSSGAPLVFIHGTPWSSRVWAPYALALSPRFHVYLFDNAGYGQSLGGAPNSTEGKDDGKKDETDLDASLAGQAEVFAALLKSWNLPCPPHIIAHDNGGLISLRANIVHGCAYASLCLVDVVAVRPFGSPFFRLVAANPDIFNSIPEAIFEGLVRSYISGAAFKPLRSEVLDMLAAPWVRSGTQDQEAFIRQMIQADQKHAAEVEGSYGEAGKKIPVKIIWAKDDAWVPVDRAEKLARMIGTDDVVLVDEAGHLIHYDQPEWLGIELGMWMARHESGAAP